LRTTKWNYRWRALSRAAAGAGLAGLVGLLVAIPSAGQQKSNKDVSKTHRISAQINGEVSTHEGLRLKLGTDLGTVRIHVHDTEVVDYKVELNTDSSEPHAQDLLKQFTVYSRATGEGVFMKGSTSAQGSSGRLWVTFDVNIPRNYSVDIVTGGGSIETEDINGRASLTTAGGNITAGAIRGSARFDTGGGHVRVKDVSGDMVASTGGGHISGGAIAGSAVLHTGGGHIRVTSVGGAAKFDTGGGNISVEKAGAELVAATSGGQIDVGEASGNVRARTVGGGIRVVRVTGSTNLETGGGSIYLTQVDGAVRATTAAGQITAWLGPEAKLPGGCDLQSSDGDIVVYIPRELPVTIDALVRLGDEHRLIVDPAFPLKVSYDGQSLGGRMIRAEGPLNGGGEVLKLRAIAGNIRLALSDTSKQLEIYREQMDELQKQRKLHLHPDDSTSNAAQ
jgi:DUF4097 and DUF4098 domain-containing protein YvlB